MPGEPVPADRTRGESDLNDSEAAAPGAPELTSPVATAVYRLLADVVAGAGVELLDVEWTGGTLRVILDHPQGVTTDNLTTVNRLISPILDQHDPVPGRYTLEVSSPGIERPLRRLDHYRRAIGENVLVKTVATVEPRRLKGSLLSVTEADLSMAVIEIDGVELPESETRTVPLAHVSTARTVFDWGPAPKPGSGKKQKKQNTGGGKRKKNKAGTEAEQVPSGPEPTSANHNRTQLDRNEVGDE